MRWNLFSALLLPSLAWASTAGADLPPPSDYKDPCLKEKLEPSCQKCVSPEFKSPGCHTAARDAGQVERCRGWSYVVYCPNSATANGSASATAVPSASASTAAPHTPPGSRCGACSVGANADLPLGYGGALGLAGACFLLARRRKARPRP